MKTNNKNKNKGFTLIEVVAVMAIITILAAVLIPNVTGYITEARKFEVLEQARKVVLTVETINMKSKNTISKDALISSVISERTTGLIEAKDIDLLDSAVKKISDCYSVVDIDEYDFTIKEGGTLDTVVKK